MSIGDQIQEKLDAAEKRISQMLKEQDRQHRINQVLIAAEFITQKQINDVTQLIERVYP